MLPWMLLHAHGHGQAPCSASAAVAARTRSAVPEPYVAHAQENKFWEEAFQVYEKGVAVFKYPHVKDIWKAYLSQFVQRYGGSKLERARDLFRQALDMVRTYGRLQPLPPPLHPPRLAPACRLPLLHLPACHLISAAAGPTPALPLLCA